MKPEELKVDRDSAIEICRFLEENRLRPTAHVQHQLHMRLAEIIFGAASSDESPPKKKATRARRKRPEKGVGAAAS